MCGGGGSFDPTNHEAFGASTRAEAEAILGRTPVHSESGSTTAISDGRKKQILEANIKRRFQENQDAIAIAKAEAERTKDAGRRGRASTIVGGAPATSKTTVGQRSILG